MTAPRLIRCINGHVFDVNSDAACPVCGWTDAPATIKTETGSGDGQANPPPDRRMIILAGATVIAAGAGAGVYALLNQGGGGKTEFDKEEAARESAAKSANKPPNANPIQQPNQQDAKSEPKPSALPAFRELQAFQPMAQMAAASTLKLSPFVTDMALLTRAVQLSARQPLQLYPKRLLVNHVTANQPQALAEAGSACALGNVVRIDDAAALDYLTRASGQGAVRARIALAQMRLAGRGAARDSNAAGDLLALAARADSGASAQALTLLKSLNRTLDGAGPTSADLNRAVTDKNWPLAVNIARVLAAAQIGSGYTVLGERHWEGVGLDRNPAAAVDWWKKASAIGYPNASYHLSQAASDPQSGPANIIEAMVWMQIAFLQSDDKPRALYFTDKVSARAGLLDGSQWAAMRTLFADLPIPGPQ
jgi:TPR repeat protein